ncbi:MAG: hypothetical protein PUC64_01765 [Clostridium sp.]|nr:hypothetical protein [Clostridium sp.]
MSSPAGSTNGIGDNDLSTTAGHRGQRPLPNGRASGSNDLSPTASIGKQQLFFDCVHFRAVSQALEGAFPNGKPSEAAALSANEFPGRQYQRHRGLPASSGYFFCNFQKGY